MADIRVPTLGESVTEATVGKWFKQPGDAVAVDEPLVELETDKVTLEVPAPAAGVLSDIAAKTGDTVGVGALLGQITDGAGAPAKAAPRRRQAARSAETGIRSSARGAHARSRELAGGVLHAYAAVGAQNGGGKRHRRRQGARLRHARPGHQRRHDGGDRTRRRGRRRRSRPPPPRCRCARRRRPTMPRAKSACT